MIKIIGFDMDDTLLDDDKNIPDLDAVKKAIDNGVKVVLCSGRPFSNVTKKYYDLLEMDEGYFCGYNGAVVYDIKTKDVVYENSLDSNELFFIMDVATKGLKQIGHYDDAALCIHYDKTVYTNRRNKYIDLDISINKTELVITDELVNDSRKAHKFTIDADPAIIQKLSQVITPVLENQFNIMISSPHFLEFIRKDASKYTGLLEIAKMYGFSEDEIMTFGDSMNDYELIKHAYLSIAMGNSMEEIKLIAKDVTDTNHNHGIKKALEKYGII